MYVSAATAVDRSSPTPLLDRLTPLPPPASTGSGSRLIVGVAIASMLAVLAVLKAWDPAFVRSLGSWLAGRFAPMFEAPRTGAELFLVGCSVVVAAVAGVVVHEAGHVLGGLLAGFRFHSMAIGPIKLDRSFRVSRHRGALAWSGGWVKMFPVKRDRLLLRAHVLVLAGPAASLFCGGAVLLLPFPKGLASAVFIAGTILGGVVDLLPVRSGATAFDGWRILRMLRHPAWGERWLAVLRLTADLREGVLPEALPDDDLARAIAMQDDSLDTVTAHAIAYSAAFHRRQDTEAGRILETCLRYSSHAPPGLREALMSDAAVFQARRRQRVDLAEQWLAAMPAATPTWLRTRAEAAILEGRGDVDAASRTLDRYEDTIRSLRLQSEAQRDLLLLGVRRWKAELGGR